MRSFFLILDMTKYSILISALFLFSSFIENDNKRYERTPDGPIINWTPDTFLKWEDFKAENKPGGGFAVASSTCGFGYEGIIKGDNISVNVYVRFYCNDSWHHKDYYLNEVLKHEQLHFDICELYGRIFYKNILLLRKNEMLNERNLKKLLTELMEEYDQTQDRYDDETNHSTDGKRQAAWYKKIMQALQEYQQFADYREF